MFFDLISKNSKRNRKENGLFFSTLLIAIVAFYLILSLENQDVMKFLVQMESDAVNRIYSMIPLFYMMTLVILFFLVFFACRYQLDSRRHEFGMYQMMGMRRPKLFFLLLAEDMKNSLLALIIGLPVGVAVSEIVSLITAKLVGLGIIGHTFSISVKAVVLTTIGFLVIKTIAFLILSGKIAQQEIGDLLHPKAEGSKKQIAGRYRVLICIAGAALLCRAYAFAISGSAWQDLKMMAITVLCGLTGTFLFFFGMSGLLEKLLAKKRNNRGLHIFTFRQLQEELSRKSSTMAISSLLILAALGFFGVGVSTAMEFSMGNPHVIDYTFEMGDQNADITDSLKAHNLENLFSTVFDMKISHISTENGVVDSDFSLESLVEAITRQPDSERKEILLHNLAYEDYPYLIAESGYNRLLKLAGKKQLDIQPNEAVVYMSPDYGLTSVAEVLNPAFREHPQVLINGEAFTLTDQLQNTNLVVDRAIYLSFALILNDEDFDRLTQGHYSLYQNAVLAPEQLAQKSLLRAVMDSNELLDEAGIPYESYLKNIGRSLFFVVATSYITIYLAIVFMIIANTVIGIQFLTRQQQTKDRYTSLIRIGASYAMLRNSARKQINWYFGIPIVFALISSMFAVRSLLTGTVFGMLENNISNMMIISGAVILLLCVVECIYILIVKKSSDRYLLSLMTLEREE